MKPNNTKPYILVSACLLGAPSRYDGQAMTNNFALQLVNFFNIIPICPEADSGLSTPRDPSEILDGKVISSQGKDVSEYFARGAKIALEQAKKYNVKLAILKEKSPSCGFKTIYDGTFSGKLIKGQGMTTRLLLANNIKVIPDTSLEEFIKSLHSQD